MGSTPTKENGGGESRRTSTSTLGTSRKRSTWSTAADVATPRTVSMGTYEADGHPNPKPPSTTKEILLKGVDFQALDECALDVPQEFLLGTFWDVVEYLVITPNGKVLDQLLKVRAIFRWLTSYDVFAIDTEVIPPENSPLEYFMKIQCGLGDHAHMFYSLCQLADIPCVIINGMAKNGGYEIGGKVDRENMHSQWNAVFIKGSWRLIDTFWASSCIMGRKATDYILVDSKGNVTRVFENGKPEYPVNEFYFMPDPKWLISSHYPDQEEWQLLESVVSIADYENKVYLREQFHKLGMSIPCEFDSCRLKASDKALRIQLNIPPERSKNIKFKYALLQTRKQIDTEKQIDIILERFVRLEHTKDAVNMKLRFPITGKFVMDLYATDLMIPKGNYELVCSYSIFCAKKTTHHYPFPDCPELGWGPNPHSEQLGLVSLIPEGTVLKTETGICNICVGRKGISKVGNALRNVLMDDAVLSRHSVGRFENDKYFVDVKLPKEGDYALNIYASSSNKLSKVTEMLTFLIKFKSSGNERPKNVPFPNIAGGHLGEKEAARNFGVTPLTYKQDCVPVTEGQASFVFSSKEGIDLICELSSSVRQASTRMTVQTKKENNRWIFDADMPITGEYSLNVFAVVQTKPKIVHEIYSYLIHSSGRPIKEVKFNDDFEEEDIIAESMKFSGTVLDIPVPPQMNDDVIFATIQRRDAIENVNGSRATLEILPETLKVMVKDDGEYMMDVYEKDVDSSVNTIARFTISKGNNFKTYNDDIEELVKMLKPEEPKKKVHRAKKVVAHKKAKKAFVAKKNNEEKRKELAKSDEEATLRDVDRTEDSVGENGQEGCEEGDLHRDPDTGENQGEITGISTDELDNVNKDESKDNETNVTATLVATTKTRNLDTDMSAKHAISEGETDLTDAKAKKENSKQKVSVKGFHKGTTKKAGLTIRKRAKKRMLGTKEDEYLANYDDNVDNKKVDKKKLDHAEKKTKKAKVVALGAKKDIKGDITITQEVDTLSDTDEGSGDESIGRNSSRTTQTKNKLKNRKGSVPTTSVTETAEQRSRLSVYNKNGNISEHSDDTDDDKEENQAGVSLRESKSSMEMASSVGKRNVKLAPSAEIMATDNKEYDDYGSDVFSEKDSDEYVDDSSSDEDPILTARREEEQVKRKKKEIQKRKKSLSRAMQKKDLKSLVNALQEYKKIADDTSGTLIVEDATRIITQLKAKDNLIQACHIREKAVLAKAIHRAKKVNSRKALDIQIILASRILQRLNRIERLSGSVLEMNQNMLTEMKTYQTPPNGVYESLVATFLLLGENIDSLKNWRSCQGLLFKTGKENIMRKISNFDPKTVPMREAKHAKKMIAPYTVLQIRDVSKGAATFYVWVKGMIGEIFTTGRTDDIDSERPLGRHQPPRNAMLYEPNTTRQGTIVMRI